VSIQNVEPLIAHGDEPRLRQLLLNLVDNAVKYTPQGGRVTLSLRQARGGPGEQTLQQPQGSPDPPTSPPPVPSAFEWAEIAVSDTGVGIPPEALPRIFERFYRVDDARSRDAGGTGLGLCIARTIAEAHGGRIEVESEPGAGSTFTVRLPLAT